MPKDSNNADCLLLDTHIWIWLINGDKSLSGSEFLKKLSKETAPQIHISVISVWELAMLEQKNRVSLPFPCQEWVRRATTDTGIKITPLSPEIAIESAQMSGTFHGDPADRMIITTSIHQQATLVTRDTDILAYCENKGIKALKA